MAHGIFFRRGANADELTIANCKEQLLYEILDPAAYHQDDVIADFTTVRFDERGPDRIAVSGGSGRTASGSLVTSTVWPVLASAAARANAFSAERKFPDP